MENFNITLTGEANCTHDDCVCTLTLVGNSLLTADFRFSTSVRGMSNKYDAAIEAINGEFLMDTIPYRAGLAGDLEFLKIKLAEKKCMTPVRIPFHFDGTGSRDIPKCSVNPIVLRAMQVADFVHLRDLFGVYATPYSIREVWKKEVLGEVPSLSTLILQKFSGYFRTVGTVNGRPFVISTADGVSHRKHATEVADMNNDSHKMPDCFAKIKHLCEEAMLLFYHKCQIYEFGKCSAPLNFTQFYDMALSASAGINFLKPGTETHIPCGDGNELEVTAHGKKQDLLLADLRTLKSMICEGVRPTIYFNATIKDEHAIAYDKQYDKATYDKWTMKMRLFVIPSSLFIYVERLVCRLRHLRERGHVILVGHPHSRGGVDKIAKLLGVTLSNCWKKILEEGDGKKFDKTVTDFMLNWYFSTTLIHEDPSHPDYPIKMSLLQWIIEQVTVKLMRIFADLWCYVDGEMPSGIWDTSHGDSWIMAMYFFLFCIWTLHNAPLDDRAELEDYIYNLLAFICYGDDFLYNRFETRFSHLFTIDKFAAFALAHLRLDIRDWFSGVSFCSETALGLLVTRGACFLKQYFVLNPEKGNGQCDFLPFRETHEFIVRAVYGKEAKIRDPVDVMLSCIGHAYGTYASNKYAYNYLRNLFLAISKLVPGGLHDAMDRMRDKLVGKTLKKIRTYGVTAEEVLAGFPSWDRLIKKNVYDPEYHSRVLNDYVDVDFGTDYM